jgi:hypothetical protein
MMTGYRDVVFLHLRIYALHESKTYSQAPEHRTNFPDEPRKRFIREVGAFTVTDAVTTFAGLSVCAWR